MTHAWLLPLLSLVLAGPTRVPARAEAVAVVAALSGTASATECGDVLHVHRFQWLTAGCFLETGAESTITLAFADGARYELRERARVAIRAEGLRTLAGTVRTLEPFPPMPRVTLAPGADVGTTAGVIRIREGDGELGRSLYPRDGAAVLARAAVVRFASVEGAKGYRVEIEDESARVVLMARTEATSLAIPAGILKPGLPYWIRVQTLDRIGATLSGRSRFSTVPAEPAAQRDAFRQAAFARGDAESLALLAAVDLRLGLRAEARDELQAALAAAPGDTEIAQALDEVLAELVP